MERGEKFEKPEPEEKISEEMVELSVEPKQDILEHEEVPEKKEKDEEILKLQHEVDRLYNAGVDEPKTEIETRKNNNDSQDLTEKKSSGAGIAKKMGILIGKSLSWTVDLFKSRVEKFDIECSGTENLKELEEKPYILAVNHIKPKNILMQAMGLSPDSFIIRRVVQEETQRIPNAIANVSGKMRKIPVLGHIDRIWSPFREGMMEGAGFVPVKMRRGGESAGFNRNFVEKFREAVGRKEPIIIFSQGHWDKDFNSEREFETGTATLAKKYDLPIVPIYVKGGRSWSSKERASVSVGQIINPVEKTKEEITDEIKGSITNLQETKANTNDKT